MGRMTPHKPVTENESKLPPDRLYAICGLLLLASSINYMDRQTLANVGTRVTTEFALSERQYGALETSFGYSFATGSMVMGILADRVSIRLLYPTVLLLWSAVGFLTGMSRTYDDLLICRGLLGFFEAGHWPCGLKTLQSILAPGQRAMGNGVLQSGTSIGAIITPLIMLATLTPQAGSWRFGFQLVGAIGLVWIVAWFWFVRPSDFAGVRLNQNRQDPNERPWWRDFLSRRMLVVVLVVSLINITWQTLRAWLPKIMQQEYGYGENFTFVFTSGWYAMTDVGCLGAGALALGLASRGWGVKSSRSISFGVCAGLCALLMLAPWLSSGPLFLCVLLLSGAGALGLFPIYYSLSQDVSQYHQGKVAGVTGVIAWSLSAPTASLFGWLADELNSFRVGLAIAGGIPILALFVILFLWPNDLNQKISR